MVWWLLKKRDEEAHKKIDHIHNSIQGSFGNIRKDIEAINEHIKHHNNNSESFHKRLLALERRLIQIEEYFLQENEESDEETESINKIRITNLPHFLEDLTEAQKRIFFGIHEIESEIKQAVSLKSLATLLYKDKDYEQIRPLLSSTLTILKELDLIDKKLVGKKVYISISPHGKKAIESEIKERKRKR